MVFIQHFACRNFDLEVIGDNACSLAWHDRWPKCVMLGSRGLLSNVGSQDTFGNFFLTLIGNGGFVDPETQHIVRLS